MNGWLVLIIPFKNEYKFLVWATWKWKCTSASCQMLLPPIHQSIIHLSTCRLSSPLSLPFPHSTMLFRVLSAFGLGTDICQQWVSAKIRIIITVIQRTYAYSYLLMIVFSQHLLQHFFHLFCSSEPLTLLPIGLCSGYNMSWRRVLLLCNWYYMFSRDLEN